MPSLRSSEELEKLRQQVIAKRDPNKPCVTVCAGTGCLACGAAEVVGAFREELAKQGLGDVVEVRGTGCHGFCEKGPIVVLDPEETCYLQVTPKDVPEITASVLAKDRIIERLLYVDPVTGERTVREPDIPFYRHQKRLVFGPNRKIDPQSIEDYLAIGGYRGLAKALFEMSPEQVVAEVKESKLRGRGGAGFPTGVKWEFTRRAPEDVKYVVVNCDEGDPGAYMDRSLMEGNPHSVLEGLLIGAYAIGAHEGFVYIRQEYPLAVKNLEIALRQAEEHGLLGENILGSGFGFSVKVHWGAGAFVCGEETALLVSLEGRVGEPRPRPPFPAIKGLWGRPTNINNVETWANVPLIINEGAAAFASIGTEGSKGTKIFSLVGKIANTGLVEVPMGLPLRDVIYKIGGGVPKGKKFKAMQTGGPSGGCIPESQLDLEVGFDELTRAGSMMGSGGMIVMDEDTCMVDVARYFVEFLTEESCGKCVPCREGLRQMHRILTRITQGLGQDSDLEVLQQLAETAVEASLCALGKTSPNPFLSTLRYFREEYEAHIREKRCPALSCKALINYYIDPAKCTGCTMCLRKCPTKAIEGGKKKIHVILQDKCTNCGTCLEVCPARFGAVKKLSGVPVPPPLPEDQRAVVTRSKEHD
ncbi:MAG: NADH-ubiquinone oxidoreductase-F iron-sulfur binding region domain-containing protein [Polyangia bacterium]|jgi:NADH-quinone oxidoreductase subunit F|nr:NADH-ubiquinone oxidoreductase-F iron-sulfur binding region domain-containing protein [Polyangia bacterium]